MTEAARSHPRNSLILITFIEDKAKRLHHSHYEKLIDNGSSAGIIFTQVLNQLNLSDKTLQPIKNNLWGFA